MRLDKLLSNMNIGSRKEVKEYIKKGLVSVNGEVIYKAIRQVDEIKDKISFRNEDLNYEKYVYIMLNKPKGYISASKGYGQKTVIDLLGSEYQNRDIFPCGRLDKDTEGLLLLTNDGRLCHNLLAPKKKVWKKYYIKTREKLKKTDIDIFDKGVYIKQDDYYAKSARLEIISDYEAYVYIQEGKYHQVKRMLEAVSNEVLYLKRLSMGTLDLDYKLDLGQYRKLYDYELDALKNEKKEHEMTDKKDFFEAKDQALEAEVKQRNEGCGKKPSNADYSSVKKVDPETGVEEPTENAVEEAKEWSEENQK